MVLGPSKETHEELEKLIRRQKEGVELWLKRSGSLPLNLSFEASNAFCIHALYLDPLPFDDQPTDSRGETFRWMQMVARWEDPYFDFMQMIVTQSQRWRSLSLRSLPPPFFESLRILNTVDLPLLETVCMYDRTALHNINNHSVQINASGLVDKPMDPDSPILSVLQHSPALRSLRIELQQQSNLDNILLPWSRLTVIDISFYGPVDGFHVLRRLSQLCPSAVKCSLEVELDGETPSYSGFSGEWTHIRELKIIFQGYPGGAYDSEIRRTFDAITTPALVHLSVYITYGYHEDPNDADCAAAVENNVPFHSLIERSQSPLLTLDIQLLFGPKLLNTLNSLSGLRSLTLHPVTRRIHLEDTLVPYSSEVTMQLETVLGALTPSQGLIACPSLEHIQLCLHPNHATSFWGLLDARASCTGQLKTFTANFGQIAQADIDIVKSAQHKAESQELSVPIQWKFSRDAVGFYGCEHFW
ncbi:hypothetical protein V5O48_008500 [Marasmius crinis-equi]|uniref:F-box domain-containing protein n=1 Tax=Marasmius crinis-equi TaxID=585013 RepID=A0ABR3F813_9AGAR